MKLSERIELTIYVLEQGKSDYEWYIKRQKDEEYRRTDLIHELEGAGVDNILPPKYEQRAQLATKLQHSLLARRIAKDAVDIYEPIFDLLESDMGKNFLNKLKVTLGEVRKRENNKTGRKYFRRAADEPPNAHPAFEKLIREWKQSLKNLQ